jgi:hypothetical protein
VAPPCFHPRFVRHLHVSVSIGNLLGERLDRDEEPQQERERFAV